MWCKTRVFSNVCFPNQTKQTTPNRLTNVSKTRLCLSKSKARLLSETTRRIKRTHAEPINTANTTKKTNLCSPLDSTASLSSDTKGAPLWFSFKDAINGTIKATLDLFFPILKKGLSSTRVIKRLKSSSEDIANNKPRWQPCALFSLLQNRAKFFVAVFRRTFGKRQTQQFCARVRFSPHSRGLVCPATIQSSFKVPANASQHRQAFLFLALQ